MSKPNCLKFDTGKEHIKRWIHVWLISAVFEELINMKKTKYESSLQGDGNCCMYLWFIVEVPNF